jgi:hypothetical protein
MDRLAGQLRYLSPPILDALVRLFAGGGNAREAAPLRLARALRDPAAIESVLTQLRPEALGALSIVVDAGGLVARDRLLAEVERALGAAGAAGLAALAAMGLVVSAPDHNRVGLPDYVAAALVWFVPSVEPIRAELPSEPEPLRFDAAVILALLADSRPRVNRDGNINISDLRRVEKRLASSPRLSRRFQQLVPGLLDAHLLRTLERVELLPDAAARLFARPPDEAWAELVSGCLSSWPLYRMYALCVAAGGWVPAESLLRVVRFKLHLYLDSGDPEQSLQSWADLLLLERTTTPSGERFFRAPQAPAPETGKLVVQPSFEVLAPPDTPPHVIAQLGRFAELQHADRFANFRINEASVQLAIDEGAGVDELLALLAAHATHGVPQNVALTIAGWAQVSRRAMLSEGLAIQLDDSAQRQEAALAFAKERIAVNELGDRVLVVPAWERARVKAILRKLAVRVVERESIVDDEGQPPAYAGFLRDRERHRVPAEAAPLHARLRRQLAEPAAAAAAVSPAPPAPAPVRAPALRRTLERAARTGEPLMLRVHDRVRVVRVERLRSRGATVYAEVVTVEGDEGLALSLDEIVDAQPLQTSGPAKTAKR